MNEQFPNLTDKTLLIVAENFGLNFSGGSRATAMVTEYFEEIFNQIKVICLKEGKHNLKNIQIISYSNFEDLGALIQMHSDENTIALGDFYIAHPLAESEIPYFFVYHDNWPEMKEFSALSEIENNKIIDTYGKIFSNATQVFSVTEYKLNFIHQYTKKASLLRNGLSQKVSKKKQKPFKEGNLRILMAGNIDQRKYAKAVELFKIIEEINSEGIRVDIFGNVNDLRIEKKLKAFNFVHCKGFIDELRYNEYDLYLNTSLIENLSLAVVDAIANKTPVISFEVGGIREIINETNGRIISPFDTKKMAEVLVELVSDFPRFKFDAAALSDFDWEKSAHKMMKQMSKLVGIK